LLGGNENSDIPDRLLTETEQAIASRVIGVVVNSINDVWAPTLDLRLKAGAAETAPLCVQLLDPQARVVAVTYEIAIGTSVGPLELALPWEAVRQITLQFSRQSRQAQQGNDQDYEAQLIAVLAKQDIPLREFQTLMPGDLISTDHRIGDPLQVFVDNEPRFSAQLGVRQGQRAVQIQSVDLQAETERATVESETRH